MCGKMYQQMKFPLKDTWERHNLYVTLVFFESRGCFIIVYRVDKQAYLTDIWVKTRTMRPSLKTRPCTVLLEDPEVQTALLQGMHLPGLLQASRSWYSGEDFSTQASNWSSRLVLMSDNMLLEQNHSLTYSNKHFE